MSYFKIGNSIAKLSLVGYGLIYVIDGVEDLFEAANYSFAGDNEIEDKFKRQAFEKIVAGTGLCVVNFFF